MTPLINYIFPVLLFAAIVVLIVSLVKFSGAKGDTKKSIEKRSLIAGIISIVYIISVFAFFYLKQRK